MLLSRLPAIPYVRNGVSQGWSANRAYQHYRDQAREAEATGLRRQDFLRLYSETRALRGLAEQAIQAPRHLPPETIEPRSTRFTSGYGSWVHIYQRASGETDLLHKVFLVKSADPITPEEAEQQALEWAQAGEDSYNYVTLGVGYMGTEQFIPRLGR